MEYKPPLNNHQSTKKYRFLYCSQDSDDQWICKRCKDIESCESPLLNQQAQKTHLIQVNNDIPEFIDKIILFQKLGKFYTIMK